MNLFRKKSLQKILDAKLHQQESSLNKKLKLRDLMGFGIAAIIGAGIFSTIGTASYNGGPGVVLLFLFTAIACSFCAMAYAEFASMVPVAGSAYTYSYVAFGEIIAWLIGWSLIMEYSIGNIAVAISWSDYFTGLLQGLNINIPNYMCIDYLSAHKSYNAVNDLLSKGINFNEIDSSLVYGYEAYTKAPAIFGFHIVADWPALLIIILITWLVYRGIQESKRASNIMVIIKLVVILLVIAVGAFYVNPNNWSPFAPNGTSGILKSISAVFFAYIGFDAISSTAEECENPQRDLPKGMLYSIIICTVLYIIIALILTGMVSYKSLNVGDPLAYVFKLVNVNWISGIISISAVVAMASVLLVFQLGQPRIWMSMSRDGLLPKKFATIHPKFKTPSFATIVTGFLVGIPALFMNLTMVTDLCSIGTLFAFALVCGGILRLQNQPNKPRSRFRTPYINAKILFPGFVGIAIIFFVLFDKAKFENFVSSKAVKTKSSFISSLSADKIKSLESEFSLNTKENNATLLGYLNAMNDNEFNAFLNTHFTEEEKTENKWVVFKQNIPTWFFIIITMLLAFYTYKHNYSLIPLLGLTSCLYMMSEMGISNWIGFSIWLAVGVVIYFIFGYRNSKLNYPE